MTDPIKIVGAPGSPYTRKMRALLRYRQIPHRFVIRNSRDDHDTPKVPVQLIPVVVFPDGEAMIDSTFQIQRLETLFRERSVVPTDPVVAFLAALVEDYADEWLTKAMFHYRWSYEADIAKAASVLPLWRQIDAPEEEVRALSKVIAERQIERLWVVGSNETTGPVIEESYHDFIRCMDGVLSTNPYLFGQRPSAADFAVFGQLTQLVLFDPTPAAIALSESPRTCTWVELLEDLSGTRAEGRDFVDRDALAPSLVALLNHIGRYYAPFLVANAAAVESGADQVKATIDGREWIQKPFPYQAKCLGWLREGRDALTSDDRAALDSLLAGSGIEILFA